jgi:hypothetical protein
MNAEILITIGVMGRRAELRNRRGGDGGSRHFGLLPMKAKSGAAHL